MNMLRACGRSLGFAFVLTSHVSWAAQPEKVSAPGGCPTMTHVPLVSVIRGTPAVITAKVECPTGDVVEVTLYVRLTDAGKPSPLGMSGEGGGVYKGVVPVSMVQGISRFWYYIDAQGNETSDQEKPGVAQTRWHPVNIIDAGDAAGGAGGGAKKAALWLLAAGSAGGAYAVYDHNQGDGDDEEDEVPPPPPPPDDEEDEEEEEEEEEEEQAPSCIVTGGESASAEDGTACDTASAIAIYVCGFCPGATLTAEGSWGASDSASGVSPISCDDSEPPSVLSLTQPPGVPSVSEGDFTITVRANGQVIASIPWPGSSYFDCF